MSLLLLEGFDGGTNDWVPRTTSNLGTATQAGRTGSTGFQVSSTDFVRYTFPAADRHATYIVGFAARIPALANTLLAQLYGDDFTTLHVYISATNTGRLRVFRGDNTLLGETDAEVIQGGVWHDIELYVTLSDTVGEVKLRVDGQAPAGWSDLTNQDTKNGGTATEFDTVRIGGNTIWVLDDLRIANGAGTAANDLLGDTRVWTLLPDADGHYSQLVGSDLDSVSNWALVDEAQPSSSDYVGSGTDGAKDTYNFPALTPTVGVVHGVEVRLWAAKTDAGAKSIRAVCRSGGVDAAGDDRPLQTSYTTHAQVWDENPAAAAPWTIGSVNAAEFGAEVRP